MEYSHVRQVLVVASRTATSERLMKEIEARAAAGGCRFTLLIPDATDRGTAERTLEIALPLMRRAARAPVKGLVGGPDPFEAVQGAVREGSFDEISVDVAETRVEVAPTGPRHPSRGAGASGDGGRCQGCAGPDRPSRRYPRMSLTSPPPSRLADWWTPNPNTIVGGVVRPLP